MKLIMIAIMSSRYLHDLIRRDELLPEYNKKEIEAMFNAALLQKHTENCVIS